VRVNKLITFQKYEDYLDKYISKKTDYEYWRRFSILTKDKYKGVVYVREGINITYIKVEKIS
jgi:hypothetical protein